MLNVKLEFLNTLPNARLQENYIENSKHDYALACTALDFSSVKYSYSTSSNNFKSVHGTTLNYLTVYFIVLHYIKLPYK